MELIGVHFSVLALCLCRVGGYSSEVTNLPPIWDRIGQDVMSSLKTTLRVRGRGRRRPRDVEMEP